MVCEGCVQTISERLRPISGIREVKPKVAQKHLVVRYEPAKVKEEQLKKALDDAGYTALEA
ncbi:MAG: heavy-metal-associated domain-containing protein (plasmid) [Candidatus Manganitrophus sp.]|nr:MAG: heavy-metal-associated domain-containing protein [Candidatus Manganitrophus sp.]